MYKDGIIIIENVTDFNTDHIFDCGQCFRWTKCENGYTGMAYGMPVTISYSDADAQVTIEGAAGAEHEMLWREYLDIDRDYGSIKRVLAAGDPIMTKAIEYGYGIRILNQEKWETLLSFIISANNNIPRIRKCIESLAETLGEEAGRYDGKTWYSLPSPDTLAQATEEDLAPCRLGYRAKYLIETAKKVAAEGMDSLEILGSPQLTSAQTVEELKKYTGVGPKVANCIALFGMGKFDSFPIDVWMKRVMNRLYGIDESDTKAMSAYAGEHYGEFGGIAQQYLFYYITHCKDI